MWSTWLLPLTLLSSGSIPEEKIKHQPKSGNVSRELHRNVEFTIEEVLLLNRNFVDYLAAIDGQAIQDVLDRQCANKMRQLAVAYLERQWIGLEWFDSWGKLPSGMYHENGFALGNVDQCRAIEHTRMQHCTFIGAFPSNLAPMLSGLCIPHSCNPDFAQQLQGDYLSTQGVFLVQMFQQDLLCIRDEVVYFDGAMITATVVSATIALFVLCSTVYELSILALKRKIDPLFSSFSLLANVRSILHLVPRVKNAQSSMIDCAHGIRSLSMIWIIVLHVHDMSNTVPWENNPAREEYLRSFVASVLHYSGMLAVDTFFVLSGMLVAMSMLRELDKKGKINPLMLYLHRYIRITAPLAALILFVVSFAAYMGEGVFWKANIEFLKQGCVANWWSALLHIQNYVDPQNMCLPWTWYLSVDMQLYIISPALIYPLWRYGKRVLFVIGGLAVLSMACVLTTFLINEFRLSFFAPVIDIRRYTLTYYATHARMAVWLWGLAFGYLLHKTKETGVNLPKRYWIAGWVACFVLLGLIIFSNYQFHSTDVDDFSFVIDAFYEPLSRSVFGLCVMWIILACVNGKGGLLDEFLGASIWQPLSRLSFTMYLLHILLLVMASVAPSKTSSYFSVIDTFYRIWGAIGLTTSVTLLWSAVFEVPFGTLDKLLLRS
ncbi:LOW QUALITY PROTEIN: nose resistant to fluoxetine protein 6-like [Armigeres subalbatus]|uniref:LOW QUALITY PROTEIN: nose resistant to fluoxetine protein 6-like n=1 Tax=Armigeres subalbatus TaxID=124917 RepID=UPI002ED274AE